MPPQDTDDGKPHNYRELVHVVYFDSATYDYVTKAMIVTWELGIALHYHHDRRVQEAVCEARTAGADPLLYRVYRPLGP